MTQKDVNKPLPNLRGLMDGEAIALVLVRSGIAYAASGVLDTEADYQGRLWVTLYLIEWQPHLDGLFKSMLANLDRANLVTAHNQTTYATIEYGDIEAVIYSEGEFED